MRLRPYRKHEDDARLIELVRESTDSCDSALKPDDYRLMISNRLAHELEAIDSDTATTIIVAVADDSNEITQLANSSDMSGGKASNIVGFVKLDIVPNAVSTRPEGRISNLCVSKAFETDKISEVLIQEAHHWAQRNGVYRLTIQLSASDESAMSLYEQFHFQVASVIMDLSCAQPELQKRQ